MQTEFQSIGVRANVVAPTGFPRTIATETVADAVVRFDESRLVGKTLILDKDGERGVT